MQIQRTYDLLVQIDELLFGDSLFVQFVLLLTMSSFTFGNSAHEKHFADPFDFPLAKL